MEGIIIKMVSLESEINQDLETLVDLKIKIVSKIKQINNQDYQTLLELRYLCFKTWEEISSQMNYSIQNIYKIHGKALKEITVE
jgi:DNA-directed RNA polymerase specialized sigma subunit